MDGAAHGEYEVALPQLVAQQCCNYNWNGTIVPLTWLTDHSMHDHDHAAMHHNHEHMATLDSTTLSPPLVTPHDDLGMGMHHMHQHGGGGTGTGMEHMMSMAVSCRHSWLSPSLHLCFLNNTLLCLLQFHFGYNETILFSWWHIETVAGLIGSMIAIFLLALLYEGLKYYREYLFWKTYNLLEYRPVTGPQRNPEAPRLPPPAAAAPSPVQWVSFHGFAGPPPRFHFSCSWACLAFFICLDLCLSVPSSVNIESNAYYFYVFSLSISFSLPPFTVKSLSLFAERVDHLYHKQNAPALM